MNQTATGRLSPRSRFLWRYGLPTIRVAARAAWRLRVERGDGFPAPPFVLAANHHSFLDPPLLGAVYGSRIRFIALDDLFGNHRLLDWALDGFEVIRVRRWTVPLGPVRASLDHLRHGGVVGLFPEGTRVERFGDLPPLPGAAWLAAKSQVPLVPAAMLGTERVLGPDNKLHRGRVTIRIGPALSPLGSDRAAADELSGRWARWIAAAVLPEPPSGIR